MLLDEIIGFFDESSELLRSWGLRA